MAVDSTYGAQRGREVKASDSNLDLIGSEAVDRENHDITW